ncbi:MerR family transcriptional regulator [Nocardia sp. NPDC048505]|uniref:MerR family transcriptional regulator n=1 Tax=unclassified Nocardia TaxID=2637762 RepID=UPI0033F6CABB
MIEDTARVGIGEASRRTGVPVRTIRFYCDEGLLACGRSPGGHRTFDAAALAQLRLLRRLRGVGLGLPAIATVLDGSVPVTAAVRAERAALDDEFAALAWRRATLRALEHDFPAPTRLDMLAAVADRRAAEQRLIEFWRRVLHPLAPAMFDGFALMNLPELPADPTVQQLLAFAELVAHLSRPEAKAAMSQNIWRARPFDLRDRRGLLIGLAEAGEQVAPLVLARADPRPGPALDHFVAAHAAARGHVDTPAFRAALLRAAPSDNPWVRRYWSLTAELVGPATSGAAQSWLDRALALSAAA